MGCGCSKHGLDAIAPPSRKRPQGIPENAWAEAKGPREVPDESSLTPPCDVFDVSLDIKNEGDAIYGSNGEPPSKRLRDDREASAAVIIEEGSVLQDLKLAPWDDEDDDVSCNFRYEEVGLQHPADNGHKYEDTCGLPGLSKRQTSKFHSWRRFSDLTSSPDVIASCPSSDLICQGFVGDCSFISALSVLADFELRFDKPVLSEIIYPKVERDGRLKPVYNAHGQYGCRLQVNGVSRKVLVDDRVPVAKDGHLLCAHSSCKSEFWVTLLEKSFAKIMGFSYDMHGSNPGTDAFHLTGWIPETIPMNSEGIEWGSVFQKAQQGLLDGRCVVCLGTTEIFDAQPSADARQLGHVEGVSRSLGLVAHHAYPVLDCRTVGPYRLLFLKNPWGQIRWRGSFAPGDQMWKQDHVKEALKEQSFQAWPQPSTMRDDGRFWIEWTDILKYFSHLYISWAPWTLGAHSKKVHARWTAAKYLKQSLLVDDVHLVAYNPQFMMRFTNPPKEGAEIWVLLNRHVRQREEVNDKYIAVHLYKSSFRLVCPDAPLHQGIYSNGECALAKLQVKEELQDIVLLVSQHAQRTEFNFSLEVFAPEPFTLTVVPPYIPENLCSGHLFGAWTGETSGGCANNVWSYFRNPQYSLHLKERVSRLSVFLECEGDHSTNLRLFKGVFARPEALRQATSSGPYRQGCCVLELRDLDPGDYTLVASTFSPGVCSKYRMVWHCSSKIRLGPSPYPFAVPLPAPLVTAAHKVAGGKAQRVCFCPKVHVSGQGVRLCARLQSAGVVESKKKKTESQPLKLSLRVLEPTAESSFSSFLGEKWAEDYLQHASAVVLLWARFDAGQQCILEVDPGPVKAILYVCSDIPLAVEAMSTE